MDTVGIGEAYDAPRGRRIGLSAAIAAGGAAVVAAFSVGYALAPSLDDTIRTDAQAVPARSFHTMDDAASETAALKGRGAGHVLVTAGGWTGLVDADTGIPVSAGIPAGIAARDIRYERVR